MFTKTAKKFIPYITAFTAAFSVLWSYPLPVSAENATAYTYTISVDGEWTRTQDAYLPGNLLFKDMELEKPEDMDIRGSRVYIADTGGGRILIMDRKSGSVSSIGEEILDAPTGVFINEDGNILVTDKGLGKVVLLSPAGEALQWYQKPVSPIFGKSANFKPKKAVSDKRGNVYIISEGSYDGMIQLSKEGEFLGYFGANRTIISALESIQDFLFTEEQKAKLFNRLPNTFYNLAIDGKGMVYSISQALKGDSIKKHNVSGGNILYESGKMTDEMNFVDIYIGKYGQIYAVTETGLIYEYDSKGRLVYSFGGRAISTERSGLFTVASAIAADENDNVYVLDKERGLVQVFSPTVFSGMTHQAIDLFENGKYSQSMELWQEILKLNGISRIAHNGIGKGYFQVGDYEKAAGYFKIARNQKDYSEAFWEIRNQWLQRNVGFLLLIPILLYILWKSLQWLDAQMEFLGPLRRVFSRITGNRLISDVLYMKNFIRHPIDSFYDLRKDKRGSVQAATIVYLLALLVFTLDYLFRGFILNPRDARDVSYFYMLVLFLAPCFLFVTGNYMVSSINEGEGRIKDVYCATAYSFAPFILFIPLVTALTYVVTLNEAFIINFSSLIIWVWSGILLLIGIKEIHDYDIRDVVKNVLLTLFFMFIAVVALSIVYMLWDQGIEFVNTLIKEVSYRVE